MCPLTSIRVRSGLSAGLHKWLHDEDEESEQDKEREEEQEHEDDGDTDDVVIPQPGWGQGICAVTHVLREL